MRRRNLAVGSVALALSGGPIRLYAQTLTKLGILLPNSAVPAEALPLARFLDGLDALGYQNGRTIALETRAAEGDLKRLPELARELVAMAPDVIWTYSATAASAAAAATKTIPIVVAPVNEDQFARLVKDFRRPEGNVTGITLNNALQHEKCLQLLKDVIPEATRIGVILNPANPTWHRYPEMLVPAATALELKLVRIDAGPSIAMAQVEHSMDARQIDAVFTPADSTINSSRNEAKQLASMLVKLGLPSATDSKAFVRAGALLALTSDSAAIGRAAASYVDRILQGAKPGDLPVERPTLIRIVVNLKTAALLGITIPPAALLRTDEVIE